MAQKNLLTNGDFTGAYQPYRNSETLRTATGWAPWWLTARPDDPDWKNQQPVFVKFTLDDETVQRVQTPYATHTAGLWQQVPAAAGNRYELSVKAQAWSSENEEPGSRYEAADVNVQIGYDPTGGLDPASPLIVWSEPSQPLSRWETLRVSVTAQTSILTVFLRSAPDLPKQQQSVFWRDALLLPSGRNKRSITIVGPGDTHINLSPEHPEPDEPVSVSVSSTRNHTFVDLHVRRPDGQRAASVFSGSKQQEGRTIWRYGFTPSEEGLYDIRFLGDEGARLLSQRLARVSRQTQLVPKDDSGQKYRRVYVLLPPTANERWCVAAARGSYLGRYTVGFSADDAGIGDLEERHVLAVNPHHWPGVLTADWFKQNYPGAIFTPVVANSPADLEAWLKDWIAESEMQGKDKDD